MTHDMRLHQIPFEQIRSGRKTIELRLNDEKRRQVKEGDLIEFRETDNPDRHILTRVIALHRFPSFRELYENLPLEACGYTQDELPYAKPEDMDEYYSPDQQARWGVLGIELQVLPTADSGIL